MKNKKLFIILAFLVSFITSIKAQTEIVMTTTAPSVIIREIFWKGTGDIIANGKVLQWRSSVGGITYGNSNEEITPINGKITITTTGNAQLTDLYCENIQLTSLSLIKCPYLKYLCCGDNKLKALDLSNCSSLEYLTCGNNLLTTLNVTGCKNLGNIYCEHNQLTFLNLSTCTWLKRLYISYNRLTYLDLSKCTALEVLDCSHNRLTELNILGCTNLERIYAGGQYITTTTRSNPVKYQTKININGTSYNKGDILPYDLGAALNFTTEEPINIITAEPFGGTIMLMNHPEMRPVTSVTIAPTLQIELKERYILAPIIMPTDATYKAVTWNNSNPKVAHISEFEGVFLLYTVAEGSTVITVTTIDGYKTASCNVTVIAPQSQKIAVSGITVAPATLQLQPGYSATLTANITPSDATDKSVIWTSNNTTVATVSANGTVTAHSKGSTTINAITVDGNKAASCNITVTDSQTGSITVTGISINPTTLQLQPGYSATLTANITPSDATNKSILWASNNTNIVTVSTNGVVTAKSPGTAFISAIAVESGIMSTCSVNVTQNASVSNETFNKKSLIAYPNPTNGKVTISGLSYGTTLHIYNQAGLLVNTFIASTDKMTIDISHLNSGIYLLKTETKILKIIVL